MENEMEYEINDPDLLEKAKKNLPEKEQVEKMAEFFKVMSDPNRLKLLIALEQGEFCASDLATLISMSRSAVSHQLKALKNAKVAKSRKDGKTVYYSLDDDHIHSILSVASAHMLEED